MTDTQKNDAAPLAMIGVVLAVAGFAVLVFEVVRTLTGSVLGSVGTILLWVGVGALAVGLLLLVLSLVGDDDVVADESEPLTPMTAEIEAPPVVETPPVVEAPPVVETPPPPPPAPEPPPPPAAAPPPPAPVEATSPVTEVAPTATPEPPPSEPPAPTTSAD